MTVITRFAPSPTGSLHIGGARTALFNFLYAKKNEGKFLLRIEDTDQERSKDIFIKELCNSLSWLYLKWDKEIIYQSKNKNIHLDVANELLKKGLAYKCFCTKEELERQKKIAIQKKQTYKYSGKCRDAYQSSNKSHVIRLKIPYNENTRLVDKIQGDIKVENNNIEDFIIVRSDKTPTYMLSVVVDDYFMKVTNIIRGDDHLTNTIKQIIIYNALNWKAPVFAHIPLIHGTDGSKLSKRHGALSVLNYKNIGILPEALNNYLLRLGWGYKDKEFFTPNEALELFSLDGIGKSPARFDEIKLKSVNSYYFKKLSNENIYSYLSIVFKNKEKKQILDIIEIFRSRAENIGDIEEGLKYILKKNISNYDDAAADIINQANKNILIYTANELDKIDEWKANNIENLIKNIVKKFNVKIFDIASPIRAAVTGKKFSPSIYKLLEILGKDLALYRLKKVFFNK